MCWSYWVVCGVQKKTFSRCWQGPSLHPAELTRSSATWEKAQLSGQQRMASTPTSTWGILPKTGERGLMNAVWWCPSPSLNYGESNSLSFLKADQIRTDILTFKKLSKINPILSGKQNSIVKKKWNNHRRWQPQKRATISKPVLGTWEEDANCFPARQLEAQLCSEKRAVRDP